MKPAGISGIRGISERKKINDFAKNSENKNVRDLYN
jgi:hypothetical protein